MEAVAQKVPYYSPMVAENPRLENKLATDPTYQKRWGKVWAVLQMNGDAGQRQGRLLAVEQGGQRRPPGGLFVHGLHWGSIRPSLQPELAHLMS